jgi:putative tryptophan/tyrosine transport system substrate-binding protein
MAYAVDTSESMRRAAGYVDRILRGAKPGELPVQQLTREGRERHLDVGRSLDFQRKWM